MTKFAHSVLLVLWAITITPVFSVTRDEVEEVLPGCHAEDTLLDVAACVVDFSADQCFENMTLSDVGECLADHWDENISGEPPNDSVEDWADDVWETIVDCVQEYYNCFVRNVQKAVQQLSPCLRTSTEDLFLCLANNAQVCSESCQASEWQSPYGEASLFDLFACSTIENNILQPMCDTMSCCPPCLEPMMEVAECVVNDVLEFPFPEPCAFTCDQQEQADRGFMHQQGPAAKAQSVQRNVDSDRIYEACKTKTPGLFGSDRAEDRLAARSDFFDCVMQESLEFFNETATPNPTASPTVSPTSQVPGNNGPTSPTTNPPTDMIGDRETASPTNTPAPSSSSTVADLILSTSFFGSFVVAIAMMSV